MSHHSTRAVLPAPVFALTLAGSLLQVGSGSAHEIVGNRLFPATLAIDDPGVADELSVPTVDAFKTGDTPPVKQNDFSGEFSKRITEAFAISAGTTYTHLGMYGGPNGTGANGFQNLDTVFKVRLYRDVVHEFVMSVGLDIEWGGTGASSVGAEPFNHYTPTFYFGKGFGDLPDSLPYLRPFAVTGQIGYAIPGRSSTTTLGVDPDTGAASFDIEHNPYLLTWGATIQYSMPYLKSAVIDLGLPDFINRLIPVVEASLTTPVANTLTSGTVTTGTINPGFFYISNNYQIGIEALIPVNRQSGSNVGVIGQLHFYLDDMAPNSVGRPIFANTAATLLPEAR